MSAYCLISCPFRGFNGAVSGFSDDGWSTLGCDGAEDVVIASNTLEKANSQSNPLNSVSMPDGVICAKASMLLQVSSEFKYDNLISGFLCYCFAFSFFKASITTHY